MKLNALLCSAFLVSWLSFASAQELAYPRDIQAKKRSGPDSVSYSNTIGPLVIRYMTFNRGYALNCSLYVASRLVGLKTMTDNDEVFIFDVIVGAYSVKGKISALFLPPSQFSTLSGDIFFAGDMLGPDTIHRYQEYRGLIGGWTTTQ